MQIRIINKNNEILAEAMKETETYLVYREEYKEGDRIVFIPEDKGFYTIQFDAVLGRATVYSDGNPFVMNIPFAQKRDCYQEAAFKGLKHYLWARKAYPWEIGYRNLSINPYDCHENTALFPHSKANIETRGESVFASRNAIDGIVASCDHGLWPFASWGINRDPEARMTLEFGRDVTIDRIIFYTRADFPHDAWWTEGTMTFSDGSTEVFHLEKKDGPQEFLIKERTISSLYLDKLIKADDPSPFPALIQLEVYGKEA